MYGRKKKSGRRAGFAEPLTESILIPANYLTRGPSLAIQHQLLSIIGNHKTCVAEVFYFPFKALRS